METITILPYSQRHQTAFKNINIEWISDLFTVEPHDLEQLDHPEIYILPDGGAIFLAQYNGVIVGTVAMVRTAPGEFELAKMAVTKSARRLGIGRLLCEAAIDYARQTGATRVWLESNTKAEAAVQLYESTGFVHLPLRESPYARANVHMELLLTPTPPQKPAATAPPSN